MTDRIAQETMTGDTLLLRPAGRLDTFSVPAFEAALTEALDAGQARLVIDLADVSYVSSSGLRALLSARRRARAAGGDVALCNMASRVREIFEMVGFVSLFHIFPSVQEAVDLFQSSVPTQS